MARWSTAEVGVLELPSGRTVRGHRWGRCTAGLEPDLTLHLSAIRPRHLPSRTTWIAWPDFGLPIDRQAAARALLDAWDRSDQSRVDVACRGGLGRTGTALACIAAIDGAGASTAIALVRQQYHRRAIETPWQERYVSTFDSSASSS